MKESEKLYIAMMAVLNSDYEDHIRLEVLELLMDRRSTALWSEKREEEKKEDEE